MKPLHEFGKEAIANERIQKETKRKTRRILLMLLLLTVVATLLIFRGDIKSAVASSGTGKGKKEKGSNESPRTDIDKPASAGIRVLKKWDLPEILTEISGISYINGDRFACVQDELGTVFIYNTSSSKVEKLISFAPAGDYEGLTMVNEAAWIVRSNGHLFEIQNINADKPVVKEYNTPLTFKQNVEGLCFDKKNNRLLLAIKGAEPGQTDYKGIYGFDLTTKKMATAPVFKIALQDKVFTNISGSGKKKGRVIMPSSIGVHPLTNEIYITDGQNSRLLLVDAAGNLKKLYQLESHEFAQPEGITFKPNGELYIANEGPKEPGNILKVEIATE